MMGRSNQGRGTRFRAGVGPESRSSAEGRRREREVDSTESPSFPLVLRRLRLLLRFGSASVTVETADKRLRPRAEVIRRMELVNLMSELARLLSRRSSTPRRDALRIAHRRIRRYAGERGLEESWCDAVLLQFLSDEHGWRVA
jgi:hypothetical protein